MEQYGSYQDIETGFYAVKYRRMIKSYNAETLKDCYPNYITVEITETVNIKALDGLIKGKLLEVEDLIRQGIITEIPQYAFFVR